ncbi:type VII toxin-antitoxin system HepT family RNase toxin [Tepidanaerobacter acetatoxydans]|uniref:type VII toxin-antitoxin system HepT family RNase toxin n=1 Tax=Tepidanaerobacter acetatoxydans TaxID=499229 RepID=UPI0009D68902|nr:DUF86 domain-containing protein [Tepidanaerobacter acetatoxydans]
MLLQNTIDTCSHIISDEGMEEPAVFSDMADILTKEKVIREDLKQPLKNMMGLRNIIAHQYGDIDFKIIYKIVKDDLKDIYRFL